MSDAIARTLLPLLFAGFAIYKYLKMEIRARESFHSFRVKFSLAIGTAIFLGALSLFYDHQTRVNLSTVSLAISLCTGIVVMFGKLVLLDIAEKKEREDSYVAIRAEIRAKREADLRERRESIYGKVTNERLTCWH